MKNKKLLELKHRAIENAEANRELCDEAQEIYKEFFTEFLNMLVSDKNWLSVTKFVLDFQSNGLIVLSITDNFSSALEKARSEYKLDNFLNEYYPGYDYHFHKDLPEFDCTFIGSDGDFWFNFHSIDGFKKFKQTYSITITSSIDEQIKTLEKSIKLSTKRLNQLKEKQKLINENL